MEIQQIFFIYRKIMLKFLDALMVLVAQHPHLNPDIKDRMIYLLCNEACELTLLTWKLRQELSKNIEITYDFEVTINNLDNLIAQIAFYFPVNRLLLVG